MHFIHVVACIIHTRVCYVRTVSTVVNMYMSAKITRLHHGDIGHIMHNL